MSTVLHTALLIALLLLATDQRADAQRRNLPLSHWQHTKWTGRAGPPVSGAHFVVESPDGYLWMGARNCLIRFDGVRFTVVDSTHAPVLRPREPGNFSPMFVDRQGRLWINGPGGVRLTYVNGAFEHVLVLDLADARGDPPNPSAEDGYGLIWFKNRKPQRYENGRMIPMALPAEVPTADIFTIEADADGGILVGTRTTGLWHVLRSGQVRQYGTGEIRALIQGRDGTIWATGTGVKGTARLEGDRWVPLLSQIDGSQLTSQKAVEDSEGAIWFQTRLQGILRYHRGVIEQLTTREGLSGNNVHDIFADSRNVVWVSTDAGVDRLRHPTFTSLDPRQSVMQEIRPRFAFDESGGMWVAEALGTDLILLENGILGGGSRPLTSKRFKVAGGERGTVMTQSRNGVWVYGPSFGVLRLRNDGSQVRVGARQGFPRQQTTLALEASDGTLWVAFQPGGIGRLSNGKFRHIAISNVDRPVIRAIAEDGRGRIWIAWGNQGAIAVVERDSLVATVVAPEGANVSMLTLEHGDTLWAATNRSVLRIVGNVVTEVRIPRLAERTGTADIAVAQGSVWLAGGNGIGRISLADLHAAADGDSVSIELEAFDELDGLKIPRTQPVNSTMSLSVGPDDRVWVNTAAGIAVTAPPSTRVVSDTPRVRIEETRVDGTLVPSGSRISPRPGRVDIHFTAMGLELAERARLQYRLEGEDKHWVDAAFPRVASYSKLDPARYVFRVRALDEQGTPISNEASLSLHVAPAWNQTWWYFALVVAFIAATAGGTAVLWQRRRHRRAAETLRRQYEATLAERSRIAQDLHDTLLQGFAGMTMQLKAAELALPEQPDVAVETIQRMQHVARQSLREARERVWDMREVDLGTDDLCSALEQFAQQRTAGMGIEVAVLSSGKRRRLRRALEDSAFRIGREAVTNSMKHADARRIEILFDFAPNALRMEVRDDGRGFDPRDADEARRNGHLGLTGIQDRVTHAGGRCEILARAGGGTVVAVELPIAED